MDIKCLGTGSTGNCYLVNLGSSCFLLDAGLTINQITKEVNLNDIDFCFITHEHKDHSKAKKDLELRGVKVLDASTNQEFYKTDLNSLKIANLQMIVFPVKHGDTKCSACIIKSNETNELLLYATDFNLIEYDLSQFNFTTILIESNYNQSLIKTDSAEYIRVRENIQRHCSMENLHKYYLDKFNLSQCKEIYLCHLSTGFSNELVMAAQTYARYKLPVGICQQRGGVIWYGKE